MTKQTFLNIVTYFQNQYTQFWQEGKFITSEQAVKEMAVYDKQLAAKVATCLAAQEDVRAHIKSRFDIPKTEPRVIRLDQVT
jgi:hypothetical protein